MQLQQRQIRVQPGEPLHDFDVGEIVFHQQTVVGIEL